MTYRRAYIGVVVVQGHVAAAGRRQLAGAMRLLDQHGGLAALDLLVVLAGHVRHHVAGERRREEQRDGAVLHHLRSFSCARDSGRRGNY